MVNLTTEQAAEKLGCTRQNVLYLINAGRLAADRHGKSFVITQGAIDNYKTLGPRKPGRKPAHNQTLRRNEMETPTQDKELGGL